MERIGWALLFLIAVALPVLAVTNPVYVTDDFRVYGDTQLDEDVLMGGDVTVTGDWTVSGSLAAAGVDFSGDLAIGDSLYVAGNAVIVGTADAGVVEADTLKPGSGTAFYLRANDGQDDADINVYDVSATNEVSGALGDFTVVEADTMKPGSGTAYYLRAADGQDDADLNVHDVSASGDVTITGALEGARLFIPSGGSLSNTTNSRYMQFGGAWLNGTDEGMPMPRDGSIVSYTVMTNIDSYTPVATMKYEIRVNGSVVWNDTKTLDATGNVIWYATQARGTDTFSAGDYITTRMDVSGTLQYDSVFAGFEVVFDD